MKYYSQQNQENYFINEDAFIAPIKLLSPTMQQWYLWKFFHEPPYHPNKARCQTLLHGASTPRGK